VTKHAHRGEKRSAGDFHIARGLLDARRCDFEISVVGDRFVDECGQHRIVERGEPAIVDRLHEPALPFPLGGHGCVGERFALEVGHVRRTLEDAAGDRAGCAD
jgi:hypothetical protein